MADEALLARVNAGIADGSCTNVGGAAVDRPLEEGLVREDRQVVSPVRDDIPVLLVEEGIRVAGE